MDKVKVLLSGPINGSTSAFCTKLKTLQKSKAGPFDVCFCAGPVFQSTTDDDDNGSVAEDTNRLLMDGLPLPVYFCDVGILPKGIVIPGPPVAVTEVVDDAEIDIDADDDDDEEDDETKKNKSFDGIVKIAPNLYHLHGIPTPNGGGASSNNKPTADILNIDIPNCNGYITVAFVPPNATLGTTQTSPLETKSNHPAYVGCDLLLTSHWGQGMAHSKCLPNTTNTPQQSSSTNEPAEIGSFDVAEIASQTRPRYHVSPSTTLTEIPQFHQSLPYTNPPSSLASGILQSYHTSRFLALCPIPKVKLPKSEAKLRKCIHALGIQPLWSMSPESAREGGGGVVVDSPYTDEGYRKDQTGGGDSTMDGAMTTAPMEETTTTRNIGLSQAQTRRLLMEEGNDNQFRWNIKNNRKRPAMDQLDTQNQQQLAAANDVQNCTLFLYGLHNTTNDGSVITKDVLMSTFGPMACVDVRYPSNAGGDGMDGRPAPRYCFLDFNSHLDAVDLLNNTRGMMELAGASLTLKWSSGRGGGGGDRGPPPPPPHGAPPYNMFPPPPPPPPGMYGRIPPPPPGGRPIPPPPPGAPPHKRQRRERMTETEAADSSTLFLHLNVRSSVSADACDKLIDSVGSLAQAMLDEAINGDADGDADTDGDAKPAKDDGTTEDGDADADAKPVVDDGTKKEGTATNTTEKDDEKTATPPPPPEEEIDPALKVNARALARRQNCGFLDFASHAAASMTLATLTGNIDGGIIMPDMMAKAKDWDETVQEVQLWWSKPAAPTDHEGHSSQQRDSNGGPQLRKHHFPADARTDCWFCLASPTCEKHLIVTVYDSCYITMPKGAINQHHTLIVPVNHIISDAGGATPGHRRILGAFLDPTPGVEEEVQQAKEKLRRHANDVLDKDLFVFERAIPTRGGYHAHINCIPVERGMGPKIQSIMMAMATRGSGFDLREIQNEDITLATILRNADDDEPLVGYFFAEIPIGENGAVKRLLYKAKGGCNSFVPLQFGRDVLASALRDQNIGNWKGCIVSKEKEGEWTQQFRASFAKIQ